MHLFEAAAVLQAVERKRAQPDEYVQDGVEEQEPHLALHVAVAFGQADGGRVVFFDDGNAGAEAKGSHCEFGE